MMKSLKTPLLSGLIAGLLMATGVSAKDYSLPLTNPNEPATLSAGIMRGSVTVIGYDGKTIEISANPTTKVINKDDDDFDRQIERQVERSLGNDDEKPKRSMKGLKKVENFSGQIEIVESNNHVEIESHHNRQSVDFVIKVPFATSLKIEQYKGGNIKVNDVRGALELASHRGSISVQGAVGPIVAESMREDIEVVFSDLDQTTPSSLTSHRGSIDITLSAKLKAKIKVQTHRGEVYSGLANEFVVDDKVQSRQSEGRRHVTMGGMLSADVNGGGQTLSLMTYRGDIYIRK